MAASMVSVAEARARAARTVERSLRDWAAGIDVDAGMELPLHPPTEKAALADLPRAMAWASEWRAVDERGSRGQDAVAVVWGERRWPSAGTQRVPERCVLRDSDAIAAFAGAAHRRTWQRLRARADELRGRLGSSDALGSPGSLASAIRPHARTIEAYGDDEFTTLLDVVDWLIAHPASGRRIRQLPIRGIDTKWLEAHRGVVEAFVAAVTGAHSLGLLESQSLVRVRFLDPALRPGGLLDVAAPVDQLAALQAAPSTVFVFENLETMLSMPEMAGAVVVHGSGYAVTRLGGIPWIRDGRIVYWGDLDSDGFRILDLLRAACGDVTSILMDEGTLLEFADLWVRETRQVPGEFGLLSTEERRALARIRAEGGVRLEQERIPWARAFAALEGALHDA
ncbi:Wadjet anti-phage system protein JetD domain-containing protein [Agromyces sp. H66]|uniref:Wadjet anti-phage system protein JetD domain-containing protein n=1 Tax=Agromyces sp. H66 TaxID=2529859 RepID=UPI0010AB214E|nr:Wadjet anti-phage system protein JetD domain-containing protein [Agromyces sp. H66]